MLVSDNSVDACVTDPPAGISFMGKDWDSDKGGRDKWISWLSSVMLEVKRVLKPGGHAFVWALPRTSHWTGTALEDAGFEMRDAVHHIFGSGFPKSLDVSKQIDKAKGEYIKGAVLPSSRTTGASETGIATTFREKTAANPQTDEARQWEGWGSALKPAVECWWLVRKPLSEGTIAENVLRWGTGAINIDKSRIVVSADDKNHRNPLNSKSYGTFFGTDTKLESNTINRLTQGRFPANLVHDGSDEVLAEFEKAGDRKGWVSQKHSSFNPYGGNSFNKSCTEREGFYEGYNDDGSPARFFKCCPPDEFSSIIYCPKASRSERDKGLEDMETKRIEGRDTGQDERNVPHKNRPAAQRNQHPCVKALSLMRYLITMITPPGGIVLDPFCGSGSTLVAARQLGFKAIGVEIDASYSEIAKRRIEAVPLPLV